MEITPLIFLQAKSGKNPLKNTPSFNRWSLKFRQ